MKNLLKKELTLALHPTVPLFLSLSAMLLIPNYPYLVAFFYTGLAVFFMCLNGRENNDIPFTMLLPAAKRDVVRARFAVVIGLQILQMILAVPFAVLRQKLIPEGNAAGMEANITLFACAMVLYGIFNLTFFSGYYKNVSKVGMPFLVSSIAVFVWIGIVEACTFIVPFMRDQLDTGGSQYLPQKLLALAVGTIIYAVLTCLAYKRSAERFETQDL